MYGWFVLRIYLSIFLSNIEFRIWVGYSSVCSSWFYVHLMYIKVVPVLELSKGVVTVVIIAFEPSAFPRSCPFVAAVV